MRTWLTAGIVVVAWACLPGAAQAQSGCGGLLQPPCPAPTPAPAPEPTPAPAPEPTPTPAPAPAGPLSERQVAELEPLYAAAVKAFSTKATRADERRYSSLCNGLFTGDALLRQVRTHCIAEIGSTRAFSQAATCKTATGCRNALRRGVARLKDEIDGARRLHTIAGKVIPDGRCRSVVRIPANDVKYLGILRTYARDLLKARTRKAFARADRRFNAAVRKLKDPRLPSDRLTAFRSRCKV